MSAQGLSARQRIEAIDIHRTGAADTLPAGAPERERRVDLALDPDQDIKNHGAAGIDIHFIRVDARRAIGIRIEAINLKASHVHNAAQWHDRHAPLRTDELAGSRNCAMLHAPLVRLCRVRRSHPHSPADASRVSIRSRPRRNRLYVLRERREMNRPIVEPHRALVIHPREGVFEPGRIVTLRKVLARVRTATLLASERRVHRGDGLQQEILELQRLDQIRCSR